jgi:capping protein beta
MSALSSASPSTSTIATCLNLMRRLPPSKIEQSLSGLLNLSPALSDELLQRVDQPLQLSSGAGRKYLLSDYNRDGDSHRSPWTNCYAPAIDDGFLPPGRLRELEVEANALFDSYRELYYEGGVSSV